MVVDPSMLEAVVRSHLNVSAQRTMVVLEPLEVNIKNLVSGVGYEIEVADFPDSPERGKHKISFGQKIFIERSDFREEAEKGYRRLLPGQAVGLRYAGYVIKLVKVNKNAAGQIVSLDVESVPIDQVAEKPKAFVHWVSDPVAIEVRLYERLFKHKNPEDPSEVPGGFLSDVNKDSLKVLNSFADKSLLKAQVYDKFQFERIGFFSVDTLSSKDKLVFNRTVSLKEDAAKK
jgi:glutaminyl-tRNA synthetase